MISTRFRSIAVLLAITPAALAAQSSFISGPNSLHSVGFKSILVADPTRKFKFAGSDQSVPRPIRMHVWYPSRNTKNGETVKLEDYVYSSSLKKQADQLSDSEKDEMHNILKDSLSFFRVTPEELSSLLKIKAKTVRDAPPIRGRFPLLIFGNVGEGYHFTEMAELLASSGYVVAALPSVGTKEGEPCGYDVECLKLQQDDMAFAIQQLPSIANVDASKIGLIGWSFSGLAVAYLQTKNPRVKVVVSLDSATGYQYGKNIFDQTEDFDFTKTTVPFLHLHGLNGDSRVPKRFSFFNSFRSEKKLLATFRNLQHSDFASLYGITVRQAKKEDDKNAFEGIRWVNLITLAFLNAHLKSDGKSSEILDELSRNRMKETAHIFSASTAYEER